MDNEILVLQAVFWEGKLKFLPICSIIWRKRGSNFPVVEWTVRGQVSIIYCKEFLDTICSVKRNSFT